MIEVDEITSGFEVKFLYRPWIVSAIKQIPGAHYMGGTKTWFVPDASKDALFNWVKPFLSKAKYQAPVEIGEIEPMPELTVPINLKAEMFPFQKTGVAYSLSREQENGNIGVIVGDEPGLGKTVQAIATVEAKRSKCVLVICPNTLKENWKIEIEQKWTNSKAMVLTDRVKSTWPTFSKVGMVKYFICNYESLKKFFVAEIKVTLDEKTGKPKPLRLNHITFRENIDLFDAVIIDEVHRCKDGKTQQSKFTMGISRSKQLIVALTGTPIVNKPIDLITQLYIINRLDCFGGYKRFVDRYCTIDTPAAHLKELNYLMHKHCFYRREKKEVLTDLPDKMRNIVTIDISNRAEYKKAEDHFINYLRENLQKSEGEINTALRGEAMVQIQILKKIAAKGKIEQVIDHIQEVTDAGQKIVVFAWHIEIVKAIKDLIPDAVTIVGDDSLEARNNAVTAFQKCKKCGIRLENHSKQDHDHVLSDVNVMICNIKSGGVGITLTASSRVGFIELPWTPADCDQCEDRTHRISQKDSVEASYFLGKDTIDEYIYELIEKKRKIVQSVLGDEVEVETKMIDDFINLFAKKNIQFD